MQRNDRSHAHMARRPAMSAPRSGSVDGLLQTEAGLRYGAGLAALAWWLSNTLTTDFCREVVQEAIIRYGCPEIVKTDQGCQFTSPKFTGLLKTHGV